MPQPFSYRYQFVLGTDLHVLVAADDEDDADRAEARVVREITRLSALLSTYDANTALSQWMRGHPGPLPDEVEAVLALAQEWYVASDGAFHPGLAQLRARWQEAERQGRPPDRTACADLAAAGAPLPFVVHGVGADRRVERTGDCRRLDLDALAKGWIVDRAAEAGLGPGVVWVMVNVGGDLRVVGPGSVSVGVEDPTSTVDNAGPVGVVTLREKGLASSGSARRGYRVGDAWFGHVLDPRSGWPVDAVAGVTVIAPDACTADVLATVAGVAGVAGVHEPQVAVLLRDRHAEAVSVSPDGDLRATPGWSTHVASGFALPVEHQQHDPDDGPGDGQTQPQPATAPDVQL